MKKLLGRKIFWIGLVLALVAIFLVWKFVLAKNKDVVSGTVEKGTVTEELILSGEVKAEKDASLNFSSSGKVAWIGAKEGETVQKGQALAKLDTVSLNSALQSARASLRQYDATTDRVHDDVKDHSSDETWLQRDTRTTAEATKDRAYEAVVQAEDNLKNATLLSPFAGMVTFVADIYPGMNILYTTKVVEIIDPATIYFAVSADQNEVIQIKDNQEVKIVLDSYPDQEFEAQVVYIGLTPKQGETGAVYDVKVKFRDGQDLSKLRIGMTGDARFVLSEKNDVLYVAPKFINTDLKGKYLKTKGGRVDIETGAEGEDKVEVSGNIKEGDLIYE